MRTIEGLLRVLQAERSDAIFKMLSVGDVADATRTILNIDAIITDCSDHSWTINAEPAYREHNDVMYIYRLVTSSMVTSKVSGPYSRYEITTK